MKLSEASLEWALTHLQRENDTDLDRDCESAKSRDCQTSERCGSGVHIPGIHRGVSWSQRANCHTG